MIPCASCGAAPTGSFNDGSPSYRCGPHDPVKPEDAHPAYRAAIETYRPLHGTLDEDDQKLLTKIAKKVAGRYERDKDAHMKFRAPNRSILSVVTDGLGAELFVARWLDMEWWQGTRRKPDVGRDVEVRCVRRRDGLLALYSYDKPRRRYVFVIGQAPTYRIVGWLVGVEGMVEKFWHPKGSVVMGYTLDVPRFLIPQSELHPMAEFDRRDPDALSEAPEGTEAAA